VIHREGYASIIIGFIISVLIYFLFTGLFPGNVFVQITVISLDLVLGIFLIQFFRNPYREIIEAKEDILCPADGKVVVIEKVVEMEFLKKEAIQVSIFMSPLNIHKNLNPVNGIIQTIVYHPGKFLVAFNPKSSTDNERCSFLYEMENGNLVVMRQIAGAVARRIVHYLKPKQTVKAGLEMGFIKFGSRVDLFIPTQYKLNVQLGDKVRGGQTIIAAKEA